MSVQVDFINDCVKTYRSIGKDPLLISAEILNRSSDLEFVKILSKWTERNLEKGEITKFQKHHLIHSSTGHIKFESMPVDITQESLSKTSASGKFNCIVREIKQENKKKTYLEIWNQTGLFKNFDINAFDVHGDIYCDGEFSSLEWSPKEDKVIYIAEKRVKKTEPFYKQKSEAEHLKKNDIGKSSDEEQTLGDEYLYKPDWGEQLVDKHQPVVGLCDITSESLKVLKGIPSNFSPGQVIWTKDGSGIFGVVFENEPRRLGLTYCTNRLSYIFHLDFSGAFKILSDEKKSVHSLRLNPDGSTLFWLQRPVGGVHYGCQELIKLDLSTNKREVMIGIVRRGNKDFSGLYMHDFPVRCFSKNGNKLFFSTLNRASINSYYLDIKTKGVHKLFTGEGSSTILDVFEDVVLISTGSFRQPPALKMSMADTEWILVTTPVNVYENTVTKEMEFEYSNPAHDFKYFNAIYYGSAPPTKVEKMPLIVYPHGGPHSATLNDFSLEHNFFVALGYGILGINYRGSIGAGQDGVEFLRGKLGDTDVKDIHEAVLTVLKTFSYLDSKNVFLYGKSYGGFLVCHLSAHYPDFYRAVVSFNGVSDVYAMYSMSDIPDWCTAETGFEFDESKPIPLAEAMTMINVSPIRLIDKIKTPTLILVGEKDRRVPFYQGLLMYNALKARKVKVRLNCYNGNHTLNSVPVHIDSIINSALWFFEHKL